MALYIQQGCGEELEASDFEGCSYICGILNCSLMRQKAIGRFSYAGELLHVLMLIPYLRMLLVIYLYAIEQFGKINNAHFT